MRFRGAAWREPAHTTVDREAACHRALLGMGKKRPVPVVSSGDIMGYSVRYVPGGGKYGWAGSVLPVLV